MALKVSELDVEDLDCVTVSEQRVPLGKAEQAQYLLGRRSRALPLL